jgi:Fur family transcriptional regulator, peroxide stress response regulator
MRRFSKQKEAILHILERTCSHPTADDIYRLVRKELPHISKGTVYRNLKVLQELNRISEIRMEDMPARYEIKQMPHYHFRCEQCGCVLDIDEPVNGDIDKRVAEKTGFKINGHQTEFRGLCNNCQRL